MFFTDHPAALLAAGSGVVSAIGGFLIRYRKINASIERTRIHTIADAAAAEASERALFRTSLMAEMSIVRGLIKECETDRDALRQRLNVAEGQILILKASNEIMEKWVAFFRDGTASQATSFPNTNDQNKNSNNE